MPWPLQLRRTPTPAAASRPPLAVTAPAGFAATVVWSQFQNKNLACTARSIQLWRKTLENSHFYLPKGSRNKRWVLTTLTSTGNAILNKCLFRSSQNQKQNKNLIVSPFLEADRDDLKWLISMWVCRWDAMLRGARSLQTVRSLLFYPLLGQAQTAKMLLLKSKICQSFNILFRSHIPFPSQPHQIIKLSAKHWLPQPAWRDLGAKATGLEWRHANFSPHPARRTPYLAGRMLGAPERGWAWAAGGRGGRGGAVAPPAKRWAALPASRLPL